MKTTRLLIRQKRLLFLVSFSIISLFAVPINVVSVSAQTKDSKKKIIKKRAWGNEPIEIVSLKTNQKDIKLDEIFEQDTDWLKDFTIKYKNNSGKNIIWLGIALDFPTTKSTGNIMAYPLSSGSHPRRSPTTQETQSIKPGETIELTLNSRKYERLKTFIEKRHSLDSLGQVNIRVDFILFEDGTGWSSGQMMRQETNNPRRWIPIDSKNE